ncbi:MAG: preprotein translocase subunit SecA [Candidatus Marinimicrobia bacterium]|nr:preprotein translocase subunit SecA [Candidatus Neomarinimicrobiota bacterium]|tara:strand:+ start:2700 stop:5753 length:3054 start_codon:yes stop_codon:yes gene_type:complete
MIGSILNKIFGNKSDKDIKRLTPKLIEINSIYKGLETLSDDELVEKYQSLKKELSDSIQTKKKQLNNDRVSIEKVDVELNNFETTFLNEKLPIVFAIVKDVARRLCGTEIYVMEQKMKWDMVHYDEQLIGGIILHQGKVAEMKTGEGKTLVSTLPIVLNALTGRGVHVITVNDYLAERDSQWMGYIYKFLNITVGCNLSQLNSFDRREVYSYDITYGTNSTFGFDYLRDNMAFRSEDQVQRGHVFAIIDEVDSVLIDESRTPLIISGQVDAPTNQSYDQWRDKIESLIKKQNNLVTKYVSEAEDLLESNKKEAGTKLLIANRGFPRHKRLIKVMQKEGVQQLCYSIESEYLRDKKMAEIDENLYFTIDEKSNIVDLSDMGRNELSSNEPESFVIPDLGEIFHDIDKENIADKEKMAKKEKAQLLHSERSDRIHTINQLLRAFSLFFKDEEYIVKESKVQIVDEHTGRVMHGRRYSDGLHQALEAKERVIIEKETQTVATITIQNYFRMYEKLAGMTGTAMTEAPELMEIYKLDVVEIPTHRPVVRKDHNDMIYKTKREKYNACLDKIQELSDKGQPVLVGTTSVEESETLSVLLTRKKISHNVLNAKQHDREAEIITRAGQKGAITISTNMAGRGTDIKLGEGVDKLGGLFILGTGRHESRRIDLQLRGRAGRQGDEGESIFFLSLEDNLMRLFGSERIAKVMDRLGLKEGEVITHSMVSKSIERAQKKIESRNFSMRKNLIEYDDVMNQQRTVVYDRRNQALNGDNIYDEIDTILYDYIDIVMNEELNAKDIQDISRIQDIKNIRNDLMNILSLDINNFISEVKNKEDFFKKIQAESKKILEFKNEQSQDNIFEQFLRFVVFRTIDQNWKEHLHGMDQLREGINLRAYGQKNPLVEYKQEGYKMFEQMILDTNVQTLKRVFRSEINNQDKPASQTRNMNLSHDKMPINFASPENAQKNNQQGSASLGSSRPRLKPMKVGKKFGRNDKVKISNGSDSRVLKYKKAKELIEQGWNIIE